MKRFVRIILILLVGSVVASCQKQPFLSLNGQKDFKFSENGGSETITFSCNRDWTVSSSETWLEVSPSQGSANEEGAKITVTCEANTTFDSRTGTVTIMFEGLSETISVSQDINYGFMLEPASFNLTKDAQDIEVEVKANVEYTITIDDACRGWISQAGTKALSSTKYTFSIAANENYEDREGKITISQKGSNSSVQPQVITVKQAKTLFVIPFEDANFKDYCVIWYDTDGDGEICIEEAEKVEIIEVDGGVVKSLKGIEYFTRLKTLNCCAEYGGMRRMDSDGKWHYYDFYGKEIFGLTSLDVSKNTALINLFCLGNQLTSLDVSNNPALLSLHCNANQLTSLDVSNNPALIYLVCEENQFTSLDVSNNPALIYLECDSTQLTSLDVSKNPALNWLSCSENQLTSLDISNNTALMYLYCFNNQISTIYVWEGFDPDKLTISKDEFASFVVKTGE